MAIIKSVSLSRKDAIMLEEMELSPTSLLRAAIEEIRKRQESIDPNVSAEKKLEITQRKLTATYDFLNKRGLFDDFLEEKRTKE